MQPSIIFMATSAYILIILTVTISAEANMNSTTFDTMTCAGKQIPTDSKDFQNYVQAQTSCSKEMMEEKKNNKKDRKRGEICRSLCAVQKYDVVNENGVPNKKKYEEIIKNVFQDNADHIINNSTICFDKTSDLKIDSTDYTCKSHKTFIRCISKAWASVCEENFDEVDWE